MGGNNECGDYPVELIVYGTGWCPDVRRSRRVLEAEGVSYRYVDLAQDRAATRLVRRFQHGARRIPTIVWPDGSHVTEPDDEQLRSLLRAGRPRLYATHTARHHTARHEGAPEHDKENV